MTADLAALERVLSRTALRMRVQRGLAWAVQISVWVGVAWLLLLASVADGRPTALVAVSITGLALLAFLAGALLPVRREQVAVAIDAAYALEGRVAAAVSLLREPAAARSRFACAALRDADLRARALSARQVHPWRRPRGTASALIALGTIAAVLCLANPIELGLDRAKRTRLASEPPSARALLDHDELEGVSADLPDQATRATLSPELQQSFAELAALRTRIERGVTPASDLIASALALEDRLRQTERDGIEPEDHAALAELARELRPAQPALSRALASDLPDAARQLHALAERMKLQQVAPEEQRQLAEALQKARERERARLAELAREQQLESLLKRSQAEVEAGEPSLLKRRKEQQRELESLQRKRERPLQRELQKLTRELARAASALREPRREPAAQQEQREQAADALQQGAQATERMQQQQRAAQSQRELEHAVAQLRELLQQRALRETSDTSEGAHEPRAQSQPGPRERERDAEAQSSAQRRARFQRLSRGEHGDAGTRGPALAPPDQGAGGGGGEAANQATSIALTVPELVESREVGSTSGGAEHDSTRGPASRRTQVGYEDQSVRGVEGTGPTRSEVIRSAAGSGFAHARYRKVYGDYREHAEALLERDQVPAGYRFQVRRYFELVRPREGQDSR